MRKIILLLGLGIASPFLLQCADRQEDPTQSVKTENIQLSKRQPTYDSLKVGGKTVDPDPPVRDGDHWITKD